MVERIPIGPAPVTSARRGSHGCREPIVRVWRDPTRADRRRLGKHPEATELVRDADELVGVLDHQLPGEAVEPRDAALAVVAGEAGVGRTFCACEAVSARPAHRSAHEVALREPVSVTFDECERLVAEHELLRVVGRDTEDPFRDLAVGAADADLEHAEQDAVSRRLLDVVDLRRVRHPRCHDEPFIRPP